MGTRELFAFLPYIRTSGRCSIRGIEFRSINDVEGLGTDAKVHVETLARMFFTCQGGQIIDPTFAIIPIDDDDRLLKGTRALCEAQMIVTYLYGAPHPSPTFGDDTFLSSECSTVYTFSPNRVIPSLVKTTESDSRVRGSQGEDGAAAEGLQFLDGYEGYRNGAVPIWVAEGSRIYPEVPNVCLNFSQWLDIDLQRFLSVAKNWPFWPVVSAQGMLREDEDRVFIALLWYGRSCRSTIDDGEKLLNLAIALEALLALDKGERLTDRFKEAVTTLLGPVPRLDEWVEQFYAARSATVHEGRPQQLCFVASGGKGITYIHRALIVYGRRIFRLCLTTVLTGISVTNESRIAALLIHNNERLEEICKAATAKGRSARDCLLAAEQQIEDLHECETLTFGLRLEEDMDRLFGATRLVLKAYRECKETTNGDIDTCLDTILAPKDSVTMQNLFDAVRKLTDVLRTVVRVSKKGTKVDEIALRLCEFASRPSVAVVVHLKERTAQ